MKTVAMITKYFYPTLGGVERYINEISTRLSERYAIKVVAPRCLGGAPYERCGNIEIFRFPIFNFKRLDISLQMLSFLKKTQPDILHFHTFEILCSMLRLGLGKYVPYFITTHGLIWEEPSGFFDLLAKSAGRMIVRGNFVNARKVFCVSQMDYTNVEKIIGHGINVKSRLIYLPSGVDARKFAVDKKKAKQRYDLSDKVVVTQVARFSAKKGQRIFLSAISRMKKIPENCIFLLAGHVQDSKYFSDLQQQAKKTDMEKRIIFFPDVTESELLAIYGRTDVFVLPSLAEGFPLSVLEAWASKCSVIASRVGGIPFFMKDGHDCILIAPNDPDALCEKILKLVADVNLRESLSKNGYNRALKEFSWDKVVGVISKEYDSAVG